MNLPNKLTVLRVILVPFFVAAMMISFPGNIWAALAIFACASITDLLDGKIARAQGLVTTFGKFLDPLADKMLVMSALVCFTALGWCDAAAVIIILAREFMVSGLRLVTANEGVVVAAGIWGKLKTAFTMVALVAIMVVEAIAGHSTGVFIANEVLVWISAVLTIISGWIYLKEYWAYIDPSK
ncbi:MAG: CDP-diacylglycerol--glycerol-3-phosphate 3-phosphatidyltransferase [Ruminococcus sp.]|nr:CDP-diacylglycerol--glycerol-3-phosphate 3-phosphatidyltransferase [Ruminococcus sp.]